MTVMDKECMIYVHVTSEVMKKIFLNIPPDSLNKLTDASSGATYGRLVAEICQRLLADPQGSHLLTLKSNFLLDENSIPMHQDFYLLDLHSEL
nr:PREDICTED: protein FAM35A-like [Latimeria chalumnae]|eukprot:XP_014341845.1 PREDICTED: protein FAM35A-like [Latimeria chalumnae]